MKKIWFTLILSLLLPLAGAEMDSTGEKMKQTEKTAKNLIVLIHGYCKGAKDMQFWKEALLAEGCDIITPDLPTTYDSFDDCVEKLIRDIEAAEPEKYENLYIAGHSMGGLMAREYLQRKKPANARRLVCVGTPHYGSKLADIALWIPFMGMIHKPLYALKTSARKTITMPDIPGLEIGVIASTKNGHWPGRLFLSREADGLVEKSSALAPDAKAAAFCNVDHVTMMYDPYTANLIRRFLETGAF